MGQALPLYLECSYGKAVATVEFSKMTYTVSDNGDGTVNVTLTFTVCMTERNSTGGDYVDFWVSLSGSGQGRKVGGFVGYVGQTRTASVEFKNVSIGSFTVYLSGN